MRLRSWTAKDIQTGTRVLLRLELNVPIVKGKAKDGGSYGRIAQALPEINRLRQRQAIVIIATHLGRPAGRKQLKYSVKPVATALGRQLKTKIPVVNLGKLPTLRPGQVCMLENLRFSAGEERDDRVFAKQLASVADVYVNNAFGVCHRKHASVSAVTKYLPSFAGELLQTEVRELSKPRSKPLTLIMGGAKLDTKLALLKTLGLQAQKVFVGGGLAVTCLAAAKVPLPTRPKSLTAKKDVQTAEKILELLRGRVVLPSDLTANPKTETVYDIGPDSIRNFVTCLPTKGTIIWNGPLGIIESPHGQLSTKKIAAAIGKSQTRSIIGGGETIEFLETKKLLKHFSYVSTGGGAMLDFLSGEIMPGLEPLVI